MLFKLGSHFPRGKILFLLSCQGVNFNAQRCEFELGYFDINLGGNDINFLFQFARIFCHEFSAQRLIRKGHVHNTGGMSFRRRQIDEAPFAQEIDFFAALKRVLSDKGANLAFFHGDFFQSWDVNFDVEMTGIANDSAILHFNEVFFA